MIQCAVHDLDEGVDDKERAGSSKTIKNEELDEGSRPMLDKLTETLTWEY